MKTSTAMLSAVPTSGLPVLPRVNLLPPEIGERRRFRRVQAGLGCGVGAAVLVVGLLFAAAAGSAGGAQGELDEAGSQQRALQVQTARYRDVTATYRRAADAKAMLTAAMGQEVRYSRFLNDLSLSMPAGVWLKSVTYTQAAAPGTATPAAGTPAAGTSAGGTAGAAPAGLGTVTLSGVAFEHQDVSTWLESLAGEKGYGGPLLQSSAEVLLGSKTVVNWSTTVNLSPDALSGRYTRTGN